MKSEVEFSSTPLLSTIEGIAQGAGSRGQKEMAIDLPADKYRELQKELAEYQYYAVHNTGIVLDNTMILMICGVKLIVKQV